MTVVPIKTTCSDCFVDLEVHHFATDEPTVTAAIPSNGKRGSLHVPAHQETEKAWRDAEGDLVYWICPACGYADSYDLTQDD